MNVNDFIKKHILTIIQLDSEYQEFEKREAEKLHQMSVNLANDLLRIEGAQPL